MKDMIHHTENDNFDTTIISDELVSISHIVRKKENDFNLFCYAKGEYIECGLYLKVVNNTETNSSPYTCFDWVLCNLENQDSASDPYRFWLAADKDNKHLFLVFLWYNKTTKNRELRSILLKSY